VKPQKKKIMLGAVSHVRQTSLSLGERRLRVFENEDRAFSGM
jgi:hypothetical protein